MLLNPFATYCLRTGSEILSVEQLDSLLQSETDAGADQCPEINLNTACKETRAKEAGRLHAIVDTCLFSEEAES